MDIKKIKITTLRYHADLNYSKFNNLLKELGYLNSYYDSENTAFGWISGEHTETEIDNVLGALGY